MIRPRSLHQSITWMILSIMLVGLVLSIIEQQWLNSLLIVGILGLTALPMVLSKRLQLYVPPEIELLALLFIFASLFLGEIREYYIRFWWWDLVLHIGSGFLLGILGYMLVYILNEQERIDLHMKAGFVALFSFAFAVMMGTIWEIFEFGMDQFFGLNMQKSGLVDTMADLIVDTVGAATMAVIGYLHVKRGWESLVYRWIERFVQRNPHMFDESDGSQATSRR